MSINLHYIDCMEFMSDKPDKHYPLSIVDPPYGINRSKNFGLAKFGWKQYKRSEWDNSIPPRQYFKELERVSVNQIIWGGNYFVRYLKPKMGWIFWDKMQTDFSTSDGELAYTSFDCKLRRIYLSRNESFLNNKGSLIHPTQKPVKLYEWLLKNYAKEGDKILDTHGGSGSICLACYNLGFDLDWCEIDKDYFDAAKNRFEKHKQKCDNKLFTTKWKDGNVEMKPNLKLF